MKERRSAFKIVTGKPIAKRSLGRPNRRWEDNIRTDIKEIGVNMRNLIDSAHENVYWRVLVNAALKLWFPYIKFHRL